MKKNILTFLFSSVYLSSFASDTGENIDQKINSIFAPVSDFLERVIFVAFDFEIGNHTIGVPFVLVWLLAAALFFTFKFNFVNFRHFTTAINIVRGKYDDQDNDGEVSHFQALTAALSGTVGLGNIAGVAVAISLGGPGATFWMIVAGFLGMSSKFVECTLGVKYRKVDPQTGTVYGGPMYYLEKGFSSMEMIIDGKKHNFSKVGKFFAILFSIACIGGSFGGGNMFQAKSAFDQLSLVIPEGSAFSFLEQGWLFGCIMAISVGVVIIGGIKSIAKVTDKIVPFMCAIYVMAAIYVIIVNVDMLGTAFGDIFSGAFSSSAVAGGIVGVMIQGFRRAAFSNEAGIGSASIAHSAVKTNQPASEGLVALLEPFIDTIVVCTMTAVVLVITGYHQNSELQGVELTSAAFGSSIPFATTIMTIAVILFAFSTMISWSYYGVQAWSYIFGNNKNMEALYKIIFCVFVVIGSASELDAVIGFSDCMIFLMCFPNIIGLYFLTPVVKSELNKYLKYIKTV